MVGALSQVPPALGEKAEALPEVPGEPPARVPDASRSTPVPELASRFRGPGDASHSGDALTYSDKKLLEGILKHFYTYKQ